MRVILLAAIVSGALLAPGRADAAAATMDYLEFQISGTSVPAAVAAKVHKLWRSGDKLARTEEDLGPGAGRLITIVHEPDEYVFQERLKRGQHGKNLDPAGRVGMPLLPTARSKSLMMLELGRELQFFHDNHARRVDAKNPGSAAAVFELVIDEVKVQLTVDLKARAPKVLKVEVPNSTMKVIYRRYLRGQPLDPSLFKEPSDIAWDQAQQAPAVAGDTPFDGDVDEWPSLSVRLGTATIRSVAQCRGAPVAIYYIDPTAAQANETANHALTYWIRYPTLRSCFFLVEVLFDDVPVGRQKFELMDRQREKLKAALDDARQLASAPPLFHIKNYYQDNLVSRENGVLVLIDRHGNLKQFDTKTDQGRKAADVAVARAMEDDRLEVPIDPESQMRQVDANDNWFYGYPIYSPILRALENSDWDALEKVFAGLRDPRSRSGYGSWYLSGSYGAFYRDVASSPEGIEQRIKFLDGWLAAKPDSVTARVALANIWAHYASMARAGRPARDLSADDVTHISERIAKARALLEEAVRLPQKCPEAFKLLLEIAREEGRPHSEIDTVFREAQKLWPGYQYIYDEVVWDYLPEWGGAPGEMEAFMERAFTENVGGVGAEMYARMVLSIFDLMKFGRKGEYLFRNTGISWNYAKQGFEEAQRRYPHPLNLNYLAYFAAAAGDKATARAAFDRLGSDYSVELWSNRLSFERARHWAYGASYVPGPPPKPVPPPPFAQEIGLRAWLMTAERWGKGPELRYPRARAAALYTEGKVYFAEGHIAAPENSLAILGENGAWTNGPTSPLARTNTAWAALNGRLYIFGGRTRDALPDETEVFDPVKGSWSSLEPMPEGRESAAAAAFGGKIYVAGGRAAQGTATADLSAYDPRSNTWKVAAPMPEPRADFVLLRAGGRLFALGGGAGSGGAVRAEIYEPGTNTWRLGAPLPSTVFGSAGFALGDKLVLVGGFVEDGFVANLLAYDTKADRWLEGPALPRPISEASAVGLGASNRVLVAGGVRPSFAYDTFLLNAAGLDWHPLQGSVKVLPPAAATTANGRPHP